MRVYKGRGLAARPEARKGPGSERGSGCLGVWGEDVCEELWPLGRRNRRLPPLSARNSGAVLTGRSNRKSGGARVAVHPPTSYFALAGGELCVCVWGGGNQNTPRRAHTRCPSEVVFSFPFPPTLSIPLHETVLSTRHGFLDTSTLLQTTT